MENLTGISAPVRPLPCVVPCKLYFPVIAKYIDSPYIKGGQSVKIADPKIIQEMEKNAKKIINLLHRGIRFTPTQPDVMRIEKIMLKELQEVESNS